MEIFRLVMVMKRIRIAEYHKLSKVGYHRGEWDQNYDYENASNVLFPLLPRTRISFQLQNLCYIVIRKFLFSDE